VSETEAASRARRDGISHHDRDEQQDHREHREAQLSMDASYVTRLRRSDAARTFARKASHAIEHRP